MALLNMKISELPTNDAFSKYSAFITVDQSNNENVNACQLANVIANKLFNTFAYTQSSLTTTNKIPTGAINEITPSIGVQLNGVLGGGQTSVTLTNSQITSSAMIDYWGKVYPTAISVSTGSITLTFDEQEEDVLFIVEVR